MSWENKQETIELNSKNKCRKCAIKMYTFLLYLFYFINDSNL